MKLPTKNDWKTWSKLMGEYSSLVPDSPILNTLAILLGLREWADEPRPPTRVELHRFLFDPMFDGPNPWCRILPAELITESGGNKKNKGNLPKGNSNTTEHLLLKKLEHKGLIQSETFKAYSYKKNKKDMFFLNPRIRERAAERLLTGKELLYTLTEKGSLYLELIMQKPWLFHSLNPNAAKRGFITISILSWSYLKDQKRTEDYLKSFPENKTIIKNIKFKNYLSMLTPITRIISEYHCLDNFLSKLKNKKEDNKKYPNHFKIDHLDELVNDEFITITETYLTLIIKEAEKFNITEKELKKNSLLI